MLKVDNINVYYGQIHALKDVSIEVHQNEIVALIGANGAGKSTTLRTISGLLRSETGSITLLDEDISKTEAYKLVSKGLAHVPEGRHVFLQMTVLENLEMGAYTNPSNVKAGIEDVFERFPRLKHRKDQIAGTLSGGEQQMLAMGRALMSKPKLLMLDEPSMGLAPILVQQIFDIIKELHNAGTTILLVEQNAEMALNIADRAYVLESGRIKLSGTGHELAQSADFSESEREAAGRLFRMAHNWTVGRGVPDTVQMSRKTFHLWQKLGDFCVTLEAERKRSGVS